MSVVSMKQLLEAGVHFGHQTRRWNPKMAPYIFSERNGVHIIDLQKTVGKIDEAYKAVFEIASQGGTILFVGTKKQAQDAVRTEAERCGMYYVNERWLGGMLTNFRTIQSRIDRLKAIERMQEDGTFDLLPKKEVAQLLTADEYAELDAYAAQVEANTGLRCVFLTGYSLGSVNERLSVYADGAQDLSLVAVDMYERRFDHYQYNATDGYLAFRLNNRETDDILDTMQPLMHGGEYFAAAKTFVSLSAEYFANSDNFSLGKDGFGENGYTGVNTPSVFDYGARAYLIFILKGALIGLAVGAIVALSLFAAYKHKVHGNTYPLDEFTKMKLTAQHDNFLYKNVVATKIESSSSSGGGGGHSGGGGGGGGHSGGRSF